jgi:hypothetical protein
MAHSSQLVGARQPMNQTLSTGGKDNGFGSFE